jgi:hypothetical protein
VLPNLIVIGAAKCGTTSLHEYLDQHPEISMSREKELYFFVEERNWGKGLGWYESQFDSSAPVRGESSPGYSAFPLFRGVPERMAKTIPGARLVYLVRDPIERIVSNYTHRRVNWPDMAPLEETLVPGAFRDWLVKPSYYWLQLEQYLQWFAAEQILVVDSDELRDRRDETLARIFEFVGVDRSFRSPKFELSHNAAIGRTRLTTSGRVLSSVLERALGGPRARALRARAPRTLKSAFVTELEPPVLPSALREELERELGSEVERLREHTGLAFAGWSI